MRAKVARIGCLFIIDLFLNFTLPVLAQIRTLDSNLLYGSFKPSLYEWNKTFLNETGYGDVHVWLKCSLNGSTGLFRGYFYIEPTQKWETSWAGQEAVIGTNNFSILLNGTAPSNADHNNWGGVFYHQVAAVRSGVVAVEVDDWRSYFEFPMSHCSSETRTKARNERTMNVFTWDTDGTTDKPMLEALAASIVRHASFHRCLLNISRYEVVASEFVIELLKENPRFDNLVREGLIVLLKKPTQCNFVRHARPYWQAVYENLALLSHWGESGILFFFDPDEYVCLMHNDAMIHLEHCLESYSVIEFHRIAVKCTSCLSSVVEYTVPFSKGRWEMLFHERVGKVAVRPDTAGLMYVHFAKGRTCQLNASSVSLMHFRHFYGPGVPRHDTNISQQTSTELSSLFVCDNGWA